MQHKVLAVALLSFSSMAAHAFDSAASISVGTTGVGLHFSLPVQEKFNIRLGANAFPSYSHSETTDDLNVDMKLKAQTFDLLADYHVFGGSFRFSTGAVYNGMRLTGTARPTSGATYDFDGRIYSAQQVGQVDARIDFRKVAPYLGIGWGRPITNERSGLGFFGDFGVLFTGSPRTRLTSTNCQASAQECRTFQNELDREANEVNEEAKDYKLFPVIRIGLSYRF